MVSCFISRISQLSLAEKYNLKLLWGLAVDLYSPMCVDIGIMINDGILSPFVWLNCLFDEQKASQIRGCLCFQTVASPARPETSLWSLARCAGSGRGYGKVLTGQWPVINGHTDTSIITHRPGQNKENQHPFYHKILQFSIYLMSNLEVFLTFRWIYWKIIFWHWANAVTFLSMINMLFIFRDQCVK